MADETDLATGPQPDAEPNRLAQPVDAEQPPQLPFLVVGVGASAGGIEAFGTFLDAMPSDGGMAFVFILHLPPDAESHLGAILGRRTNMPVRQIEDGMPVEADRVYVIRPGHVVTISNGHLRLGPELGGPRAANRPIDDFFRSLAEEQRERAVCVILSGMGSNGTAGAQAVKAVGGLCVAQDPESAEHPSMPRHLVDAGYADHILCPAEIPAVLLAYAGSPYATGGREADAEPVLDKEGHHLREVLAILRTRTKQDFNGYKKPTVLRRVQRRMGLARLASIAEYAKLLRQTPAEVTALGDDLLIHVTGFFRDPDAWDALRRHVIVPLVAGRKPREPVRAWVAACSSGEEAYSLAMLLVEESERAGKLLDIKVFATDLADRTLAHARAGVYPGGIESEISKERLERFFAREAEHYRVRGDLRDRVVFAPQNILQDPPFSRLDIATCRNLLIYLEPDVQKRVFNLLHFGLREGGVLFLGSAETVSGVEGLFEVVDKKARLYRRVGPTRHGAVEFPLPHSAEHRPTRSAPPAPRRAEVPPGAVAEVTRLVLLESYTPPAVTVDRDGQILYFHGDAASFLRSTGDPTHELLVLAREGVRGAARTALHRAVAENARVTVPDGWVDRESGRRHRVAVTAAPAPGATPPAYFVIGFDDRGELALPPEPAGGDARQDAEVRRLRSELQGVIEEMQSSNEELKASNEEVTSVNEELQSANEELVTSKEEMQSLNEELSTVNVQLRVKADEHQAASSDLSSLLTSTNIAVLFLDTQFRIRRFTPAARDLIDLIPGDVGRPVSALARKFDDPALDADCRTVLERLAPLEREVAGVTGRHYLRRVTPYRTTDNRIDGVVVTFVDVTARRSAEGALRDREAWLRGQREALEAALNGAELAESLGALGRTAVAALGEGTRFAFYLANADGTTLHHMVGMGSEYAAAVDGFEIGPESLACGLATATGEPVLTADVMTEPRWEPWRDMAARFDYRGCWSFPIHTAAGHFVGTFAVYSRQPREATPRDREMAAVLTRTAAIIIARNTEAEARTRAEEATRESRVRFRSIANLVPDLLWSSRPDGYTDWYNQRWSEYTGQTLEQTVGWGWTDAIHPDDRDGLARRYRAAVESGGTLVQEHRIRRSDGEYRWFLVRAEPVRDDAGRLQMFGSATDIHEQRTMVAALRLREAELARVQRIGEVGGMDIDVAGGLTSRRSPEYLRLHGLPPDTTDESHEDWLARLHPADRGRADGTLHAALNGSTAVYENEYRIVRAGDGRVRWIKARADIERDPAGKAVRLVGAHLDVTDQKLLESDLRESEERLRLAVAAGELATWDWDVRSGRVVWNDAHFAMQGYEPGEVAPSYEAWVARIHPDDRAVAVAALEAARDARAVYRHDFRALHPDDTVRWLSARGTFFYDGDAPVRMVGVMRDVTDQRETHEALRVSEERLRLALAAARMGTWSWDLEADAHQRDANLNALLGLPAEETTSPFAEFLTHIHPDDRGSVQAAFDQTIRHGRPLNIEFRVLWPDGAVRWLRDQGDVFGVAGQARMTGACADVTDLKEAEAAVRASEERLRLTLESATDHAILTLAPDRTVTSWSPGAEAAFGYATDEIVGRSGDVLFTPEDRAAGAPEEETGTAHREGRAGDERWHLRKDGTRFFASGVLTPLGADARRGFVKVARDLTERKRMEDALRRGNDELEERVRARTVELERAMDALEAEMARRRNLARRLSSAQEDERQRVSRDLHDNIGQLMAGLSMAFKSVESSGGLPAAAAARLADARQLMADLGREVHGLAVRLRPTSLDDIGLEAALGQLVAEWSYRTQVPAAFQSTGVGPGRLPAEVETTIYRVVQEALSNVAKHARAASVDVTVTRPDGFVSVVVEDDGAGFDPGAVPKGRLGLLGMRERVELVGGETEIESGPGAGTTVIVQIPIPTNGGGP